MHHLFRTFVPVLFLAMAACDDGTGPGVDPTPETANVDVLMDASVLETESGVVVNGRQLIDVPWRDRAVFVERYLRYAFGGFPELSYPQSVRSADSWRVVIMHAKPPVERNDSTILSYVDHGEARLGGVVIDKHTELPHVHPDDPTGFENFVMYFGSSYTRIAWLEGGPTHEQAAYHERLVAGDPVELTTTGSGDAAAASAALAISPMATLVEVMNGGGIELNAATPPTLTTDTTLVLTFDRALDPARAYIVFLPFANGATAGGARGAFVQPQEAASRIVIPGSVLAELVAGASSETVAYRIFIEEFWSGADAFTGVRANGEPFSLPLGQESETTLHVYLQR